MKGLINVMKATYGAMPTWVKQGICIVPFSTRMGPHYRGIRNAIAARRMWSADQWREYQFHHVKLLLAHAYETVPFYKDLYDGIGFTPGDFRSMDDLSRLPVVTREMIRTHGENMVSSKAVLWKCYRQNTGGSSGSPLAFWLDPESSYEEWAYLIAMWERAGYSEYDRIATLRGHNLGNQAAKYDPMFNELVLSSYHLDEAHALDYVKALRKWKPRFLRGYPSALAQLADIIAKSGIEIRVPISAALCGSEALFDHQRERISAVFGCACYHWYGHTERVILAGWGYESQQFHCFPDYGITELLDVGGAPITNPGETGELVGTGLLNYSMPLIRYKTNDLACWGTQRDEKLPGYPTLDKVQGRVGEYVRTSSGKSVSLTALIHGQHLPIFEQVSSLQMIQVRPGEATLLVVPRGRSLSLSLISQTVEALQSACGGGIEFQVLELEHPIRTPRGKACTLVNHQDIPTALRELIQVN